MNSLPKKSSLTESVLLWLREEIESGRLKNKLPAERALCERLKVSRSTLRLAITRLKQDGWLEVVKKRTYIRYIPSQDKNLNKPTKQKKIAFLSPVPLEDISWMGLLLYSEIGSFFSNSKTAHQFVHKSWAEQSRFKHQLDSFVRESDYDAWVLYRSSNTVQKYFQKNALPAVIFGNAHEGITLPALTIDFSAALNHCLSSLKRFKHKPEKIILFLPDTKLAGHLLIKETFTEALGAKFKKNIHLYREGVTDIEDVLAQLLASENKPTVLITLRIRTAVKIQGLLASQHHLNIPSDISCICLDSAPVLAQLAPPISRYRVRTKQVTNFISSTLNQLLATGLGTPWGHRPLIPDFINEHSTGIAPP